MNALTKQAASFSESMIPQCLENAAMDPTLFDTYGVKRGLRDKAGNGVVAGLTNISDVSAYWFDEQGNKHPQEGKLSYRGYNINDLVNGFVREKRFGFEETTYLLLFSKLPDEKELAEFTELLASLRRLPTNFVRDVIMKASGKDIMNSMTRSVLTLGSYDDTLNDTSLSNVLRQCLMLISEFPMLAVYGYRAYSHYERNKVRHALCSRPKIFVSTRNSAVPRHCPDIALVTFMEKDSPYHTRCLLLPFALRMALLALCLLKVPSTVTLTSGSMMKILKHVKDTSDVDEIVFYLVSF